MLRQGKAADAATIQGQDDSARRLKIRVPQAHVPEPGMGREPTYLIQKSSIKKGRYTYPD